MPEVIVNTSPLQYLHQLGRLELLGRLYQRILVPLGVEAEIEEGRRRGVALPDLQEVSWVEVRAVSQPALVPLVTDLGRGETEVLTLALETPGALVILDDGLARRHAALLGIRTTGTLGILLKCKQNGLISAVRPLIDELDRLGFRLASHTRRSVLKLAGEQ